MKAKLTNPFYVFLSLAMNGRRWSLVLARLALLAILMVTTGTVVWAAAPAAELPGILTKGLAELGFQKPSPDLAVLTNAPYVRLGDRSAVNCLDQITEITGCTQGQGNLLFYHAPITDPLRIVLYDKKSGQALLIRPCGQKGQPLTSPCSPVAATGTTPAFEQVKLDLSQDQLLNPEAYGRTLKQIGSPAETFSIAGILSAWGSGAPYDFLKCCEFHNHYCPGVTIGYFIGKIMMEKYPLAHGQKYVWIGSPAKCGDDAIQILFDLTPGKRNCYIKELTPDLKKAITVEEPLNNVMGILVIWDNRENKGRAVVFKYDWGKTCQVSGLKYADLSPKGGKANPLFWIVRLKSNVALIPYFDKPGEFVSVAAEVPVTPEMFARMIAAGVNPYETIGLTKP